VIGNPLDRSKLTECSAGLKLYEGSAIADESGDWAWTGTATGPYATSTATDVSGNTSAFSAVFVEP